MGSVTESIETGGLCICKDNWESLICMVAMKNVFDYVDDLAIEADNEEELQERVVQ